MDLWMGQPPANIGSTGYILFGTVGSALSGPPVSLPAGIGDMCFMPQLLDPSGNPNLFILGGPLGVGGINLIPVPGTGIVVLSVPASLGPFTVTLQGVIEDQSAPPPGFRVTNALEVVVQ